LLDPPMMPVATEPEPTPTPSSSSAEEDPAALIEYAPEPHSSELAAVLQENVGERTVLGTPYAQADVISLHEAGTEHLAEVVRARGEQAWEDSGITPRAAAQRVDGPTADADSLEAVLATGGTVAIVPSSSLRSDPHGS